VIIIHIEAQTLPELAQRLREELGPLLAGTDVVVATAAPAQAAPVEAAAAPKPEKAAKAPKAAKEEKAAAPAASPSITIEALRAKMGELVGAHPDKGAVVVALLAQHGGGAKNLSGADPSTYAALMAAADEMLAGLTSDPTA
jgi:hypothetical protein